jgi:hypothetical protein
MLGAAAVVLLLAASTLPSAATAMEVHIGSVGSTVSTGGGSLSSSIFGNILATVIKGAKSKQSADKRNGSDRPINTPY